MTNADAIRNFDDEQLAKTLSAIAIGIVRKTAKVASKDVLDCCGVPMSAERLNRAIDERCKEANEVVFENTLRFLQREYSQTMSSG